jgi:hypothetical protein
MDWARVLLAGLLALLSCSCATQGQDIALAPLWTNISTAGGGREIEALAGIVRVRRTRPEGPLREWALRPFIIEKLEENGDSYARFLVPFGTRKRTPNAYFWQMLLMARYERTLDEQGRSEWSLLSLPGIYWKQDNTGRTLRAFFPFGGIVERWLTFDRLTFALFPLYLRTVRDGQVSTSFLWPIFNWTNGPRGSSYRIWPLFGRLRQEGRFDRWFFLWPIFQYHRNHLSTANPETTWTVWPLIGRTKRGSYRGTSVAWPFFGYSHDPKTGFWAWDGPWPLVRFLRPGKNDPDGPRRSRVWPFYSSYEGDGLKSRWFAFPLINIREEVDMLGTRKAQYLVPVWQHWDRVSTDGVKSSWSKLWPLYQDYQEGESSRFAFPALNPLWHTPEFDDHYAWIYELVTRETQGTHLRERLWGNIFRREKDEREDRAYLSFLWSRRDYRQDQVRRVEYSMLFGLLRWRSYPELPGVWPDPLLPAFPGPGWPAERVGASSP